MPQRKYIPIQPEMIFGRLIVIGDAPPYLDKNGKQFERFRCLCSCGQVTEPFATSLNSGTTRSCGCLVGETLRKIMQTHGDSRSVEHRLWEDMRRRCFNPQCKAYKNYGGRGITVCKRWGKYENFLADMGRRPSPELTLERINNDGNYAPGNVRWATRKEQQNNRRAKIYLRFKNKLMSLTEWAAALGVKRDVLATRLARKWPVEKILAQPVRHISNPRIKTE